MNSLYEQAYRAADELLTASKLGKGDLLVVGCSSSEITGSKIGTDSKPETAGEVFSAIYDVIKGKVVYSEEQPTRPIEDMSISCRMHCICPPGAAHKCTERRDIPGSVAFVPSIAGLLIAGEIVKDLTANTERKSGVNDES